MEKENILLVCLNVKDFDKINRLNFATYNNIVLASDDLKVYEKNKNLGLIKNFTFLQKPIPYTKVSLSIKEMIDEVNLYLDCVVDHGFFKKNEIFWTYHIEGGYNQILQETVLAIESIYSIIDKHNINKVYIIGSKNLLLVKIIEKIAFKMNIKLSSHGNNQFIDKKKIVDLVRPNYYLFKSLLNKIISKKNNNLKKGPVVLFQICGSTKKHIQNVLFIQKGLFKSGLIPLNIIWGNSKEVNQINNLNYNAVALENYLKFSEIFVSFYKWFLILIKAKALRKLFYQKVSFEYEGIDIKDIVFENVMLYLHSNGPENYRYRVATQRFVLDYRDHIIAIKYCAAKSLTQGTILSEIMEDKYLKFDYDLGLRILSPYNKYVSKKNYDFLSNNFIRFTPNEIEKRYIIEDMGVSEKSVIKVGAGRAKSHFDNIKSLSKEESKREIGIYKDYDIYILLEFSMPVSGFISTDEVSIILDTLVDFVQINLNIALIIKPNHSVDLSLLSHINSKKNQNIYLVDKKALPDHALNIADVFFCKFSTLGIEAMIYDAQVVSILLDEEKTFKVFGDAAEYIYKKEDLKFFLEKKFSSKENFIKWKNSFIKKRATFTREYYPKIEKKSVEIIVETIKNNINISKSDH